MEIFAFSGTTRAFLAATLAVIPAIVAYVRGRQIAHLADDPALPERLFADRSVTGGCFALCVSMLIVLTGMAAVWAVPLAIVAYFAAGYPLRRTLYTETWTLPFYLSLVIRFIIAFWSFWWLVAALPALALWADERAWIVSLVVGAGLVPLASAQTAIIRWLIGARPIADPAMRARFERLAAAAGLPAPHFEVVDLRGGSIANAFALASLTRSAVVFSQPLLDRLDADEVDAICAHELAHLEHYNTRRLRQLRMVSRLLIAGGTILTPLMLQLIPSAAFVACLLWPVVVLVTIALMAQGRQKHETASDLRAVALTGNPEALVRGLVKIHAIARVPRRWDADLERHMSHPSLKQRIQDIRASAGTPPAVLGDEAVFESADGKARVVFGDAGIEWIEGASASHRFNYDRLVELRIAAPRTGEAILVAADRTGHRWQMSLRASDIPRVQAVLDIVDARVESGTPVTSVQPAIVRAATFTVLIVSLNAGMIAAAGVLALTLLRTDAPLVAAAGLAAVAGAFLTWFDPTPTYGVLPDEFTLIAATVLLAGGALLAGLAYLRRHDAVPAPGWKLVGVVGMGAVMSWLVPLLGGDGIDALALHQAVREWPSTIVLPLALAGAMFCSAYRKLRVASAAAVVASAVAAGVGSQAFLNRFGGDLFITPVANVTVRTLDRPAREFIVPFGINELQVSPGGESIAAVTRRRDNRATIHIGRAGERLTPVNGDGALFIDDTRALVWTTDGSRTDLREVHVAAPETASWELQVTGIATPAVSLDARTGRWRLVSRTGVNAVETREGTIGTDETRSHEWSVPEGRGSTFMPVAMSGDRALVLEPRFDLASSLAHPLGTFLSVLASGPQWRSTLWALGPDGATDLGTSRLELQCQSLPLTGRGVCHIFDASRTRFFVMDASARSITAATALPGRFFTGDEPSGGWITGWYQSGLIAVRPTPVDAIRVAGPHDTQPHLIAVSDRAAAGVWYEVSPTAALRVDPIAEGMGRSVVRIYPLD